MNFSLRGRTLAEFLGTAFLLSAVVESGIMGEQTGGRERRHRTAGQSLAAGAMLIVLILTLGPVSGARFNPAVRWEWLGRGTEGLGKVNAVPNQPLKDQRCPESQLPSQRTT
jgi:glycerol uptake facilitator-like aquaporin